MKCFFLFLLFSLSIYNASAQVRDRQDMQFDVHVGDTIYKYSLFPQPSRWVGYVVVSKSSNNLITARSFDGTKTIEPYQRRKGHEYEPLNERVYAGKDELKRMLSFVPEFYFKMTKVKRKRGNSIVDLTKNANLKNCSFSDNAIEVKWIWGNNEYFGLGIRNKNKIDPIMIMWDDAIYVDMSGNSSSIRNVTNSTSGSHQEPTRILEDTKTTIAMIPNSCFIDASNSQITSKFKLDDFKEANSNVVRICLPVKIKGVVSRYDFYFEIDYISELEYLKSQGLIDI